MACNSNYTLVGNSVAECRKGDNGVTDSNGWIFSENGGSCKQNITVTYIAVTKEIDKSISKTFIVGPSVTYNKYRTEG